MQLKKLSIQEYLSLGYVYLIVLGIISDVIFYKFIGIDILNYSSILDVLITPIAILVHDGKTLSTILVFLAVVYLLFAVIMPRFHKANREKAWYKKNFNVEKNDKQYAEENMHTVVLLLAFVVLSMFLGFGVGRGIKMKSRLENKELTANYRIIFMDKDTLQAKIFGQTSQYIFYATENQTEVSISPIEQNIKEIRKIKSN
ncbi:MAG: hypothetical protein H6696_21040 [Deferribacteres bacterium]|nr:hypothetical protein [Deferribacteres bacterium]